MTQHSHSLLPAYEKYIEGDYYQNSELRKAFTTKRQEIWDLLREGYPDPKSPRDLYDWKRDSKYPRDLRVEERREQEDKSKYCANISQGPCYSSHHLTLDKRGR